MRGVERPGDAEVGDLHLAVAGDEDVRRLDVAVDDAARVGRGERERDRDGRVDGPIGTDASLVAEDVGEAAPVDVLHDDVVGAGRLAPVVDADDVRVVEVGGRLRLAAEALDERRVVRELGEEHLERDRAVEQLVSSQEDVGHAAPTDPALQLVALVQNGGVGLRHVEPAYRPVESRSGAARIVCITAFAIGAATRPPVASLAPLWLSTITATATRGAVGGREADDPGVRLRGGSVPSCAVPVLPATRTPGIFIRVAVPCSTTLTIASRMIDGVRLGRAAVVQNRAAPRSITSPSLSRTSCIT